NLALPAPNARRQVEDAKARGRSGTPAVGVPELRKRPSDSAPHDVAAPLGAAPLADAEPEDDPLMHLFDGDMELPEEAGEALGSLLGDAAAAANQKPVVPGRPKDDPEIETSIENSFSEFGASSSSEKTLVAAEQEVSELLDN